MDRHQVVELPWVYRVCRECYEAKPYAVWLVKLRCFQPNVHHNDLLLVSIESNVMQLVQMRYPPQIVSGSSHTRQKQRCGHLNDPLPHSTVEQDTWNFISEIQKINDGLWRLLKETTVVHTSKVCLTCYTDAAKFNSTNWLAWLKCGQHHTGEHNQCIVITDKIMAVRELPSSLQGQLPHEIISCSGCCSDGLNCLKAHSDEEFLYWKWTLVHNQLKTVPNYSILCERYSYTSDEGVSSFSQVGLDEKLLQSTYKMKFHKLICLDEIAHAQKMASLCNGMVSVKKYYCDDRMEEMPKLMLHGMEGAAMDYAIHGHARALIPLGDYHVECSVSHRRENVLILDMPGDKLPLLPSEQVYVHFEINHSYFNDLHKAVNHLNEPALQKLLPSEEVLRRYHVRCRKLSPIENQAVKSFTLDNEYQMPALKRILSSHQGVPFLVSGPFGTGKTHKVIAAAISALLCEQSSRILVCTHQNTCANSIYQVLYHKLANKIMRLLPNEKYRRFIRVGSEGIISMKDLKAGDVTAKRVIVTTFLTARKLKYITGEKIHFSHILIDEGAQAREPESLGALAVVNIATKIIIVGDHKQSGPKVAVLSQLAQKNELGVSLHERLFYLYKSKGRKNHTASLLTNYRCHSSILAFTSSLFYQHTLLSRSSSETHPLAPFPLLFACSSIQKDHQNLPEQDIKEAEVLVQIASEYIRQWPKKKPKPVVGLLATTRKQVEILKKVRNNYCFRNCVVEIKPTYLVQGEEFDAVFLSTIEPTDRQGKPHDPVRSMSHELVFNTIMTRAKSLMYCVGNPFTLCQIGDQYPINCWKAYLQRCVQCETLQFTLPKEMAVSMPQIETAANEIHSLVFPYSIIDEAICVPSPKETSVDKIINQYLIKLHNRKEYKVGQKLVQKPDGEVDWIEDDEDRDENVILYHLELSSFDKGVATPQDRSKPSIIIRGRQNLKALQGDMVEIDEEGRRVRFNKRTESEHYDEWFICEVSKFNCIILYPLDKRYPKFVNLPTISKIEKRGVVCYDPSSIKTSPKVSDVIPHRVALRMVFIVKFLRWKEECANPLGIIVGAFPSHQPYFQQLKFKLQHGIHRAADEVCIEELQQDNSGKRQHFPLAITIDPEGSTDHDDALTCTVQEIGDSKTYTVGVHITDLQCMMRKGSKLDEQAKKRGCTVYNAPDSICSPMFPDSVLEVASIQPGEKLNSFSVLIDFDVKNEGRTSESISLVNIHILESCVTSETELTYKEAQDLLQGDESSFSESLRGKMEKYNSHTPAFHLQQLVQNMWRFAWFLRKERLKDAAMAYTVREVDQLKNPEAHYLVEELMIRANTQVAKMLSRELENQTILRSQKPPDEMKLEQFKKHYKTVLPLSATCKVLNPPLPPTVSRLTMLKSQHSMLVENLRKKKLVDVKHCVQMEHLHPQLLALQSRLRSLPSSAEYCVLKKGDRDGGSHSDLQCSHYTHFTSPLRRYIDVIIQRQLHAVIRHGPNIYSHKELKTQCKNSQILQKNANEYERDYKSALLTKSLRKSHRVYDCVIAEMDEKKLLFSLSFMDVELRLSPNAREITVQQLQRNHSSLCRREKEMKLSYKLKVKICSMTFTPASFLDNSQVNSQCQLSFYSMDENACLIPENISIKSNSNVVTIPHETWLMMQRCIMEGTDSLEQHREQILEELPPVEGNATPIPHRNWRAILLVYTLSRELKLFDVMKAHLCAAQVKMGLMQEPAIQLLEVGPGVAICVQHNKDPEKCFVGSVLQQASKKSYDSIPEYIKCWEPLILSESALTSVKESEFLLVRDVVLEWPEFQLYTSSSGESYYTMTENGNPDKNGVKLSLDSQFLNTSFNFFKMSEGDLVCIRLSSSEGDTRYVFHMVINNVNIIENPQKKAEVYMKFVQRDSNYISPAIYDVISSQNAVYEFQLIHSDLSQRRIYRSLRQYVCKGTDLARSIALGNPTSDETSSTMSKVLSQREMTVAKSYWSRDNYKKLNNYQKNAIVIAWKNKFTLIQGPPGTGKSVTGAHIAYALAMRLSKETDSEGQCVMYCGPTQQSVNVVLDIFLELFTYLAPKERTSANIIRVFSRGVEKTEFRGPELDKNVFVHTNPSAKCEDHHKSVTLHHKIRKEYSYIELEEERFATLHKEKKIPSLEDSRKYRAMISEAEEQVLKRGVNIILCTCNEAASHRITNTVEPKYCIIDECAMATEPECMIPIRRAQHVILIGDHQQLHQVIHSKNAEKMGLGKSLFERYANKAYPIHVLETQYRMHPAICEFPSEVFYGGKLKTDPSVIQRRNEFNLNPFWPRGEGFPIVFCQVEGEEDMGYSGSNKVDSQSKFNKIEVEKIVDIAEKLVCQYGVLSSTIAVLTPYAAQREAISNTMKQLQWSAGIKVKTITESQGSEFGIVLLSTVRSRERVDNSQDVESILGFVADPHRICVGITRSKFGLVIVGNEKVLRCYRIWKRLIQHYKEKQCFVLGDRFPQ